MTEKQQQKTPHFQGDMMKRRVKTHKQRIDLWALQKRVAELEKANAHLAREQQKLKDLFVELCQAVKAIEQKNKSVSVWQRLFS